MRSGRSGSSFVESMPAKFWLVTPMYWKSVVLRISAGNESCAWAMTLMRKKLTVSGSFDFIVIGADSAGRDLAYWLSTDPQNAVLLLQAGSISVAASVEPSMSPTKSRRGLERPWMRRSDPEPGLDDWWFPIATSRLLGGVTMNHYSILNLALSTEYDSFLSLGMPQRGERQLLGLAFVTCRRLNSILPASNEATCLRRKGRASQVCGCVTVLSLDWKRSRRRKSNPKRTCRLQLQRCSHRIPPVARAFALMPWWHLRYGVSILQGCGLLVDRCFRFRLSEILLVSWRCLVRSQQSSYSGRCHRHRVRGTVGKVLLATICGPKVIVRETPYRHTQRMTGSDGRPIASY